MAGFYTKASHILVPSYPTRPGSGVTTMDSIGPFCHPGLWLIIGSIDFDDPLRLGGKPSLWVMLGHSRQECAAFTNSPPFWTFCKPPQINSVGYLNRPTAPTFLWDTHSLFQTDTEHSHKKNLEPNNRMRRLNILI